MATNLEPERAWTAAAVAALRGAGSWTGRIHVHKLLFAIKTLGLAKPPFAFELYHYGPYSFGLDAVIAEMEADGDLGKEYPKPDYGPKYSVDESIQASTRKVLKPHDLKIIEKAAAEFSARSSNDLELIATCIWVEKLEKVQAADAIVNRVKEIKPRYALLEIQEKLSDARGLVKNLVH